MSAIPKFYFSKFLPHVNIGHPKKSKMEPMKTFNFQNFKKCNKLECKVFLIKIHSKTKNIDVSLIYFSLVHIPYFYPTHDDISTYMRVTRVVHTSSVVNLHFSLQPNIKIISKIKLNMQNLTANFTQSCSNFHYNFIFTALIFFSNLYQTFLNNL